MAEKVWQETLEALRRNPSYSGMFHMMERFSDDTAAEVSDINNNAVKRTYREYIEMSMAACGVMEKKRPSGDVVGLIYDTCMDWPVLLWGILMSGQIPLLLNPAQRPELLNSIMAEARATAYVAAKPVTDSPLQFIDAMEVLSGSEPGEERWGEYIALCTSGTTGNSRIFLYNANTIANHILSFDEAKQINPDMPFIEDKPCKLLAFLPFHHVFGFSVVYLLYACTGKVLVFCRDKSVQTILGTCSKFGVTHLYCVPIFFNALADGIAKKLNGRSLNPVIKHIIKKKTLGTKIRSMITGGGYVPAKTLEILNDIGYPLCNGFGMTETGIIAVEKSLDPEQRKKGSIGEPFSLTEYRIGDGTTDEGELFIRGEALYSACMIDGRIVPRDKSAWFATGDIIKRTKDGLFICGRVKDVIVNSGGENIYPDEIESLFAELPGVKNSCIIGVKHGSSEDVAIVSHRGEDFDEGAYLKQIKEINETLPIGERVKRAFISNEALPVSGSMKVMRGKLKDNIDGFIELPLSDRQRRLDETNKCIVSENVSNPGEQVKADEMNENELVKIREIIRDIIAETLNYSEEEKASISYTDSLVEDLDMNSVDLYSCVAEFENRYGVVIVDTDIAGFTDINKIARYIYALLHGIDIHNSEDDIPAREILKETRSHDSMNAGDNLRITDFAKSHEYREFKDRMEAILSDGFNPFFIPHDSTVRDTSVIHGESVINLGSYNYLGMSGNKEVEQAAIEAIREYGTSASGARILAGEKTLYRELERAIADWKHTEDAIVCTGGWATNVAFVSCFMHKGDLIIYDELSHNSLTEGIRLSGADSKIFAHNNLNMLENILKKVEGRYNKVLIIVEGVYSMDGDIAPIPEFVRLKKLYKCFLMVDEAHSSGVIGKHGGGCDEYFGLKDDDIDIKYGTLSKALGTCGGYVAASREIIEYLKYSMNGFVFSAGIAPPLAAASMKAIEIIRRDNSAVTKLHENIAWFVKRAGEAGMDTCLAGESAIVPVMIGKDADAVRISSKLLEKGVFVPPAMYPAVPRGKSRLRFTISSTHSIEQLEKAISELEKLMESIDGASR
ncbi:MAG: aminotransferase class I/II-fold pyridoxal phosphate-dependent enzyme [Lachnospiraceae bacterium]|nr:aminotransferase class I/II-fold pyridoxal phosphate-dependent enzyme [Lachnospiraceae bacterium]